MRWTLTISAALAIAWAAFAASPYLALYDLARAAEARDVAGVTERVDLLALRGSLAHQIVSEYLAKSGKGRDLSDMGKQAATGMGATLADAVLAKYVTAEALTELLSRGSLGLEGATPALGGPTPASYFGSLDGVWRVFANSESRGFRRLIVYLDNPQKRDERLGLSMRLKDWTWRLSDIELPPSLRARLVNELPPAAG